MYTKTRNVKKNTRVDLIQMPTTIADMTGHSNVNFQGAMAVMQVNATEKFIITRSMAYANQTHQSKKEVFVRQFADFRQIARNHLNQNLKVTICIIYRQYQFVLSIATLFSSQSLLQLQLPSHLQLKLHQLLRHLPEMVRI